MSESVARWYSVWASVVRQYRVRSCCLLVPLRAGLVLLACLNLIVSVVLMVGVSSASAWPLVGRVQAALFEDASPSLSVLPPAADLAFTVLLLAGLYRKDVVVLRWYVYYGVSVIATSVLVYSLLIAALSVLYIILIVASLIYQAYVIILVRSVIVEFQLSADQKDKADIEAAKIALRGERYNATSHQDVAVQSEMEVLTTTGGDTGGTLREPDNETTHVQTTSVVASSVATTSIISPTTSSTPSPPSTAVSSPVSTVATSTRPVTSTGSLRSPAVVSSSSTPGIPAPVSSASTTSAPISTAPRSESTPSTSTTQADQPPTAAPDASSSSDPAPEVEPSSPQPPPKKAEKKRRRLWK